MDEHECCTKIWAAGRFNYIQCSRKGTVEVNGKWYCWQHDPGRDAKVKIAKEKWWVDKEIEWQREDFAYELANRITDEELESLIAIGGIRILLDKYYELGGEFPPATKEIDNA